MHSEGAAKGWVLEEPPDRGSRSIPFPAVAGGNSAWIPPAKLRPCYTCPLQLPRITALEPRPSHSGQRHPVFSVPLPIPPARPMSHWAFHPDGISRGCSPMQIATRIADSSYSFAEPLESAPANRYDFNLNGLLRALGRSEAHTLGGYED
ncbi:hypothetical protein KM043_001854 [Ampulex compressa]|nr:hypothetical protein KM043_001854 [Ampulex compressa]